MAEHWILGTLAAFGLLSALWAALGWLLPSGKGWTLVYIGEPQPETLTRFKWLRGLGLLSIPMIAVTEEAVAMPQGTEICSREALIGRLERERRQFDGTGN